tara:strand:- start:1043 stop:1261 length:219 start_codon:yes stop_codon:yes gene_type:complete
MKFTIAELKQIIKEEADAVLSEEDTMAAIEALPETAEQIADAVRKDVEAAAERAGIDYTALAGTVAQILTDN